MKEKLCDLIISEMEEKKAGEGDRTSLEGESTSRVCGEVRRDLKEREFELGWRICIQSYKNEGRALEGRGTADTDALRLAQAVQERKRPGVCVGACAHMCVMVQDVGGQNVQVGRWKEARQVSGSQKSLSEMKSRVDFGYALKGSVQLLFHLGPFELL